MFEATLGTSGSCWICDGRMRRRSTKRLGSDIAPPGSAGRLRGLVDELVCMTCGAREWIETEEPFPALTELTAKTPSARPN